MTMEEVRPRITGTEMEWPAQIKTHEGEIRFVEKTEAKAVVRTHDARLTRDPEMGMLSNGGRYYADAGGHPEYSTAEDTSMMGTVAREVAGEQIVYNSFLRAKELDQFQDFYLTKRVIDDEGNTCGYHINLLYNGRLTDIPRNAMATHLATMNVYAGAGGVVRLEDGPEFVVAQKSLKLNQETLNTSFSNQRENHPLISTRNKPYADGDKYSRVHITSLDANMSPWATWMKLGTTSILLRMMEHRYPVRVKKFADPAHAVAMRTARDTELATLIERRDGTSLSAVDIQTQLMLQAIDFQKEGLLTTEEEVVLHEWEQVLYDLQIDPELTEDRVEWVARKMFLERYMAKNALTLSSPRVKQVDLMWSHIGNGSVAERYRETKWRKWMPLTDIERAYEEPPTTTRALARAAILGSKEVREAKAKLHIRWDSANLSDNSHIWTMDDPYEVVAREQVFSSQR